MIRTVGWRELRELAAFRAENGYVVSLYLGLDPSRRGDLKTRIHSLLDEGARQPLGGLTHGQRGALKADFERIGAFVEGEADSTGAHGLAVFSSGLDNLWHTIPLAEAVADWLRIGSELHLAPLIPLVGRGNGTLVLLVGREQGQFYRLQGTRLVPVAERFDEQPRRHDQGGRSQANIQRHADALALEHLRAVATELEHEFRRIGGEGRIVVACPEQTWAEFSGVLSHEVRSAVVGWTPAEAHARPAELLELIAPVLERLHADAEADAVARWRDETGRQGRATAGWANTLEAASDGRVSMLLFRDGVNRDAWTCPACGRAGLEDGKCPLDGRRLEASSEGLDLAVRRTLVHGGTALAVRGRDDLDAAGGIGALLRY
jgi:peptide subunit release factor 1 (eRF1)